MTSTHYLSNTVMNEQDVKAEVIAEVSAFGIGSDSISDENSRLANYVNYENEGEDKGGILLIEKIKVEPILFEREDFTITGCGTKKENEILIDVIKSESDDCDNSSLHYYSEFGFPTFGSTQYYAKSKGSSEREINQQLLCVKEEEITIENGVLDERVLVKDELVDGVDRCGERHAMCNIQSTTKADQKCHKILHSRKRQLQRQDRRFGCSICNKQFKRNHTLLQHQLTHTKERPFECKLCNQRFSRKQTLRQHELSHTDESPFQCQFCNKQFRHKSSLNIHEAIHSNQCPFLCKICGASYPHKKQLAKHQIVHTAERSFSCKLCNKSFKRKATLIDHERVHVSGRPRPFQCNHCNKRFMEKKQLVAHQSVHSTEQLFLCKLCGKNFKRKNNLVEHYKRCCKRL